MLFGVKDKHLMSNNVTIKIAKKKKYWKSLLIINLTSPRILLAFYQKGEYKAQCSYQSTKVFDSRAKTFPTSFFIKSQFNYCPLIWMLRSRRTLTE